MLNPVIGIYALFLLVFSLGLIAGGRDTISQLAAIALTFIFSIFLLHHLLKALVSDFLDWLANEAENYVKEKSKEELEK